MEAAIDLTLADDDGDSDGGNADPRGRAGGAHIGAAFGGARGRTVPAATPQPDAGRTGAKRKAEPEVTPIPRRRQPPLKQGGEPVAKRAKVPVALMERKKQRSGTRPTSEPPALATGVAPPSGLRPPKRAREEDEGSAKPGRGGKPAKRIRGSAKRAMVAIDKLSQGDGNDSGGEAEAMDPRWTNPTTEAMTAAFTLLASGWGSPISFPTVQETRLGSGARTTGEARRNQTILLLRRRPERPKAQQNPSPNPNPNPNETQAQIKTQTQIQTSGQGR